MTFRPFGEASCEHELTKMKHGYKNIFFEGTHFNDEALKAETYLIIGRRGSGKSALAQYFTFQTDIKNCSAITVDKPSEFESLLENVASRAGRNENDGVNRISRLWETIIWGLLFDKFKNESPEIKAACLVAPRRRSSSTLVKKITSDLIDSFTGKSGYLDDLLDDYILDSAFDKPKQAVLEITRTAPVIISIDSFERYDSENTAMMMAVAGLVQCAKEMNLSLSDQGIHLKAFVSAEIYPTLTEDAILNTAKFIEDPVYLHWRPKELARIICWRYYKYLKSQKLLPVGSTNVNWDDWSSVRDKMWEPFFGEMITNGNSLHEHTFPYILRHTQNRPRQLIRICNGIAKKANESGDFPFFSADNIRAGTAAVEKELAREVVNSFARIYPGCGEIVRALAQLPPEFSGTELSKAAVRTSGSWPSSDRYSAQRFVQLTTELGIVGRVRSGSESVKTTFEADFEYFEEDRLMIGEHDRCVVHPMFYSTFNMTRRFEKGNEFVVYPFPDHPAYRDVERMSV